MKNSTLMLTSLIGGAILGSVVTCFVKSAKGHKIAHLTHDKLIEHLRHIHEQIGHICHCSQNGECTCSLGRDDVPMAQGEKGAEGAM